MSQLVKSRSIGVLAGLTVVLAIAANSYAQILNGNIIGTVKDATGSVIVGVQVTAVSQLTKIERKTVTAGDGTYVFSLLPAGMYTITAEMAGFKRYVNAGLEVGSGQTVRVDIPLELGEVTAEVSVTAESSAIQTETSDVTTVRTMKYFTRSPTSQNSTVVFGPPTVSSAGGYFGYNGNREGAAHATQDGVDFDPYRNYITAYSVDEVKVTHTVAPANFQTPVNIQIITKRGTNDFHGRIEGILRNQALNAIGNPRSHRRPIGNGNWEAGGTFTGPVYIPKVYDGRNRSFFMFTYIPRKATPGDYPVQQIHPPVAWRTGDLSSVATALRNPYTNQPFAGNIIPDSMINPIAKKLNSYFRTPTVGPTGVLGMWTYTAQGGKKLSWRGDHKVNSKLELMSSYTQHTDMWDGQGGFNDRSIFNWSGPFNQNCCAKNATFGGTYIITPKVVNEFRVGAYICKLCNQYLNFERGGDPKKTTDWAAARLKDLGLTGIAPPASGQASSGPNIRISGFTPFDGWGSNPTHTYHWTYSDNLSWQRGKHSIQTGFEYKRRANNLDRVWSEHWATISFSGRFTGNPYADFLLGMPDTMSKQNLRPITAQRGNQFGVFVTDTFRVKPNLTLSYGLRYDYVAPAFEDRNFFYSYDPKTNKIVVPDATDLKYIDPVWNQVRNPIATASSVGFPKNLIKPDKNGINPRFGFAWRPFNNDKTVVRAGYGIYTVAERLTLFDFLQTTGPFALSNDFNNVDNSDPSKGAVPRFTWPVGLPDPSLGSGAPIPSVTFTNPNSVWPYTQQGNLTLEHELARQRFRVSYIWSKETKMFYPRDINLPPLQPGVAFDNSRRPNRSFNSITMVDNGGGATYHAGEAVWYPGNVFGFSGETGLAWSKQMTDVPEVRFNTNRGNATLNPFCRACDRAESSAVRPIRWVTYLYWDVPYGKGKRYGSNLPAVLNRLIGGWEFSTEIQALASNAIDIAYTGTDPSGLGRSSGRPDLAKGWKSWEISNKNDTVWYDASAFSVPANNIGRFGNLGRNILRGPKLFSLDLGVFKNFRMGERYNILFSSQIHNPTNYSNWGYPPNQPAFNVNSPTAGLLPGLLVGKRTVVFNLAFEY